MVVTLPVLGIVDSLVANERFSISETSMIWSGLPYIKTLMEQACSSASFNKAPAQFRSYLLMVFVIHTSSRLEAGTTRQYLAPNRIRTKHIIKQ